MTFDTELFLEKIEENHPTVIILNEGSVQSVYICPIEETPANLDYIVIDTDSNETLSEELDTIVEILESAGYSIAVETHTDEYIVNDAVECDCDGSDK